MRRLLPGYVHLKPEETKEAAAAIVDGMAAAAAVVAAAVQENEQTAAVKLTSVRQAAAQAAGGQLDVCASSLGTVIANFLVVLDGKHAELAIVVEDIKELQDKFKGAQRASDRAACEQAYMGVGEHVFICASRLSCCCFARAVANVQYSPSSTLPLGGRASQSQVSSSAWARIGKWCPAEWTCRRRCGTSKI